MLHHEARRSNARVARVARVAGRNDELQVQVPQPRRARLLQTKQQRPSHTFYMSNNMPYLNFNSFNSFNSVISHVSSNPELV